MSRISEYDKFPVIPVQSAINCAWQGWRSIVEHIRGQIAFRALGLLHHRHRAGEELVEEGRIPEP